MLVNFNKMKMFKKLYSVTISVLALIAVILSILDIIGSISIDSSDFLTIIDNSILVIFTIDYLVRLYISKNKKLFFKENIFDLIAILPFNSFLRIFRITRLARLTMLLKLLRLIRLIAFGKKAYGMVRAFIYTNGFIYMLFTTLVLILLGSVGIYLAEDDKIIKSFDDAVWWSFVTATTVGYGDISPKTGLGRVIAGILMITGIGFIGMLTGTIATYFIGKVEKPKMISESKVIDLSDLDDDQFDKVISFIGYIRNSK